MALLLPAVLPTSLCSLSISASFSTGYASESPGNLVEVHTIGSHSGNNWIRFFTLTLESVFLTAPLCCWYNRPRAGSWADSGSYGHQREGLVARFAAWITKGNGVFPLMLWLPGQGLCYLKRSPGNQWPCP